MLQLGKFQLRKSVTRDLGNLNGLHDMTSMLETAPNIPSLLTNLIDLSDTEYLNTDTFEHDYQRNKVVLPQDKAFSERGDYFDGRPEVKTHLFKVPSWGLQSNVKPQDTLKSRQPGTKDDLDNRQRLIAQDIRDMRLSMALLREYSLAHLITTGTNYVPNGSVATTDFYLEYTGTAASSRPTVDFKLGDATYYPRKSGEMARKKINNTLLLGQKPQGYVALCGETFFERRFTHIKEEQAMVDRSGIDNQDPLIKRLDNYFQEYRKFKGSDGIVYIEYDANVGGAQLIADGECYIMPVNTAGIFAQRFAPAQTRTYMNTIAQEQYVWTAENEFNGDQIMFESNFGLYLVNPNSIIKGYSSN